MRPRNLDKPVLHIRHTELKRASEDSFFRSMCPVCENGVLLVSREPKMLNLARFDICISCGQRVEYLDQDIAGELLYPLQN
jgi:hypothetical protein